MDFTSQICTTKEQSKKLISLGLKAETADMCYQAHYFKVDGISLDCIYSLEPHPPLNNDDYIPAWSLHRLIVMMPKILIKDLSRWYLSIIPYYNDMVSYDYCGVMEPCYLFKGNHNNVYTNIINCIEWLIKEGHFNKEYLKK